MGGHRVKVMNGYFNFMMKQEVFKFCCHVELGARESSINFKKKVDALFIYLFF